MTPGLRYWNGSSFVQPGPNTDIWTGSAYKRAKSAHIWNGSSFTRVWPVFDPVTVTVTSNGRTEVPWWARYIDVVLLGGGAAGKRGGVFSASDGGKAGSYLTERWDRLAFPGVELGSLNIAIGGGGTGGDNGSGGNTQIWIDAYDKTTYSGETRIASGGSGTSGKREGASPGNKSFNGISAVGGGEDGGVPGAGGRGGSQNFLGGNPGADGARGQAWLRFSIDPV